MYLEAAVAEALLRSCALAVLRCTGCPEVDATHVAVDVQQEDALDVLGEV